MSYVFNIPWESVLSLTIINILAVASPGPAFIMQMKQSMNRGYRLGLFYALGVAVGIGMHFVYTFLGVAQLISSFVWLEKSVITVAIVYFTYLLWGLIKAYNSPQPTVLSVDDKSSHISNSKSATNGGSFLLGIMVSGLNPNAVIYIITIFAPLIDKSWNIFSCLVLLLWLCLNCFLYYAMLNGIFSNPQISKYYFKYKRWFDLVIIIFFSYLVICFTAKLLPTEWIEPINWLFYF